MCDYSPTELIVKILDDMISTDSWYTAKQLAGRYHTSIRTIHRILHKIKSMSHELFSFEVVQELEDDYEFGSGFKALKTKVRIKNMRHI